MHINIILGLVAIAAVYWLLREMIRKSKSPASVLREEIDQRKERERRVNENLTRIRDEAIERMKPVRQGVQEMIASLPEEGRPKVDVAAESGAVTVRFSTARDADVQADGIRVSHRLASFTLDGSAEVLQSELSRHERFVLERLGPDGSVVHEEEVEAPEEALRKVARIIATFVE